VNNFNHYPIDKEIGTWRVVKYRGLQADPAGKKRHKYLCECIHCGTRKEKRHDTLKPHTQYCAKCRPAHSYGPAKGKPVNSTVEASEFSRMKLR